MGADLTDIFSQTNWLNAVKNFIQMLIICYCAIWIWRRIVGTQAERLVKGVMVLIGVAVISYFAGFTLVTSILQHLIPVAVMALVIIFQPEIRRGLGYLGRMNNFKVDFSLPNRETENTKRDIAQIISAVRDLSKTKVGALIVVEPPEGERDYLSPGTPVNADISSNLLLSIFFPKSPLHDGAVVIRQNKIVAAGVILPMTDDPKLSSRYGTRHRAAIGLSEIYDGLCIVVSEETGSISAANRGILARYGSADDLLDPLSYMYLKDADRKSPTPLDSFLSVLGRKKANSNDPTSGGEAVVKPTLEVAPIQESNISTIGPSVESEKAV
ncbi:MAG: TIGR00159 family protein [Cyanobacteria bacterium SZAS-4]|nr:TIGR00159 family protein [Cyanobacteria bacterium SZAS-4]